jgi:hypothetical protein
MSRFLRHGGYRELMCLRRDLRRDNFSFHRRTRFSRNNWQVKIRLRRRMVGIARSAFRFRRRNA